ncbi:MAG: TolC family protein [Alphaproteobacteria bacterium]|jgi:outer membrane protein TolC|nr:TolC family protein [Alphaproteobacteria bacterium]
MKFQRLLTISTALILFTSGSALASSFEEYVQRLSEHPQVESILADSEASKAQAQGELGLPDPMFMIGVDNVPISDPAFDRFLPTSKVIGFNQKIPNPALRGAKSEKLEQMSEKQKLMADYTNARLRFMLVSKLAEYESVKTQQKLIKTQLGHYHELEDTFKGQIESGRAVYQRFSEVDVERAEAERKLNDLDAQEAAIEAEFIRLVGEVPEIEMPQIAADTPWDKNPNALYAVQIAAEDIDIAKKDVGIADAAFLPNFGVNAVYKQREDGENGTFAGDDWFSVQAQVSIPLWADSNQKPKLKAAKERERSAMFAYDDVRRMWVRQMTAIESARDAAAKNVAVLQDKDHAMKGKIDAAQRNYEAGTEDLDRVLLAKIDRLNIKAQLAQVKASHVMKAAEFNSNIAGGYKEIQE